MSVESWLMLMMLGVVVLGVAIVVFGTAADSS